MIPYLPLEKITALHADEIHEAVARVIDGGWYLRGEATARFEEEYARYIGTKHCVCVANGLDALTLIMRAYIYNGMLKEGDEVIVPANTYIATILSITENRLKPVLVEPDIDTLQIDDSLIEQAITPRTRAIMIVHLYGRCAFTPRIAALCQKHHLLLLEDNAQAHGCTVPPLPSVGVVAIPSQQSSLPSVGVVAIPSQQSPLPSVSAVAISSQQSPLPSVSAVAISSQQSSLPSVGVVAIPSQQKTGSLGHAAAHSFYPGKNLGALGDAGAVTTDDDQLAATIRSIANYGSSRKYVFDYQGRNSRIDELQAAVLSVKLRYLDHDNQRRREIAAHYLTNISNPAITIPGAPQRSIFNVQSSMFNVQCSMFNVQSSMFNVFHIFPILCHHRDALQAFLAENGVQTMIHYPIPPHKQACYKDWHTLCLPITERIHAQELSLPCHQAMTDAEVERICEIINNFNI